MRSIGAGFGLVAFLIAIAISLWMWASYTREVAHYGTQAENQARQFSGRDDKGRAAIRSVTLAPEIQNGKVKYVLVESIDPQGTYAKWSHLQQNDAIILCGPIDLREQDAEMCQALIADAYRLQQQLTVMRGGKKIVLPEGRVVDDGSSLPNAVSVAQAPATQPVKAEEERVGAKEIGPLRGIVR